MTVPINYNIDVISPFQSALQGMQAVTALKLQDEKIKTLQAQRQQAQQLQDDLFELSNIANPTVEDYNRVITRHPEVSGELKTSLDSLNTEQKQNKLNQASRVYSALETDNLDVAKSLLEEQRQAAVNSGLEDEARNIEAIIKQVDLNPNAAKTSMRFSLSAIMGPEKFAQTFKTLTEGAAPKVGTYKFNEKIGMINTTTGEVLTSLKDLGAPTTDPELKFTQEDKLRKDFNSVTKDFRGVRDAASRVRVSGKDPSAAGDLALIFNYMKILDPGSTVREGEFATAQNSAGVPDILRAQYNKVIEGKRLAPAQRNDFLDRAEKLFKTRQSQYNKTSDQYKKLSKRYGLSPENVVLDLDIVEDEPLRDEASPPVASEPDLEAILQKYR